MADAPAAPAPAPAPAPPPAPAAEESMVPAIVPKGQGDVTSKKFVKWTRDEDKQLRAAHQSVASAPETKKLKDTEMWDAVAARVPNRSGFDCEERWSIISPPEHKGCCHLTKEARCGIFMCVFIAGAVSK